MKRTFHKFYNSSLFKDTGIYMFFKIFDKLIPFFLLPIITRVLSPGEYGVFILFQAMAGIALPLMTLSVDSSILLNYFKVKAKDFRNYFSSGYILLIISSGIIFFIIITFKRPISILTTFPINWIVSILVFSFFQFHSNLALNMFQVKQQPKKYGIYSLSLTATNNILMLLFIIVFGMKWQGMILGYIIGYSIFFLISIYLFRKDDLYTKRVSKEFILDNIRVGYPLSLHRIGIWLSSSATRIIISGLLGTAATGSFGVGASIGMIVLFIQDSFNKAFVPYLFNKLNNFNEQIEKKLIIITYAYNVILLVSAVVVGILGYYFLDIIFGSAYAEGKEIVLLIALAFAFNGMYKMHVNYIFYTKKTYLIFLITMMTGLLNIALSYLFVEMYGIMGGALSLCIINLVGYIISWYIGNRVYPMKWFNFRF